MSVDPGLPVSQTLVNATQTEGDCGSSWSDLNETDRERCGYREVDIPSPTSPQYLTPVANGDTTAWTVSGTSGCNDEGNEWTCTDDHPNDGDSTFIRSTAAAVTDSIENLGTVDVGGAAVASVVVSIWCRTTATKGVAVQTLIKTHGVLYAGSNYNCPSSSYGTTSTTYATNPYTGAAWTQAEIDALQAGVRDNDKTNREVRASEIRVAVNFVPPPSVTVSLLPDANGDTTAWAVSGTTGCDSEGSEWNCTDDQPNDGDATFIRSTSKSVTDSVENLGTTAVGGATVLKVVVNIWCRTTQTRAVAVQTLIKTHGVLYAGSNYNCPSSSYGTTSTTYATNPYTGAAWTQAEIDALQAGVRDNDATTREVRTSEVRVDVELAARYSLEVRFAWSGVPTAPQAVQWLLDVDCTRLSPGGENVLVQIGQGGNPPSSWKTAYTCASDTEAFFGGYALSITELNNGAPVVRVWDNQQGADVAQGTMALDVLRIEWSSPPSKDPYVFGTLRNGDGGSPARAYVAVTNLRTNETIYDITESGGYVKSFGEFTDGYQTGDPIAIEAADVNGTGLVNRGTSTTNVPPPETGTEVNIGLAVSPRTNLTMEDAPPSPSLSAPGDLEPDYHDLVGAGNWTSPPEPEPSSDNCNAPDDPTLVWVVQAGETIVCEHRGITRQNDVEIHGSLTFIGTSMRFDFNPTTGARPVLTVYAEGSFIVTQNSWLGSTIVNQWPYWFHVYGTFRMASSWVDYVYGDPSSDAGGIIFHAGSHGLIDTGSWVEYGYTHGIYARDVTDLTVRSGYVWFNGQSEGNYGHGIFLDQSYALISGAKVEYNDESGIYVRNTGLTKSCYGKPYDYAAGAKVAFWVWCTDGVWHVWWTSDGTVHTFSGTITYEGGSIEIPPEEATVQGGHDYTLDSEWIGLELEIDGNGAEVAQINVGTGSDHPTDNPFTLHRTVQPVIRSSRVFGNDNGIYSYYASPTIIDSEISYNSVDGIDMVYASRGVISGNSIDDNQHYGILLDDTSLNVVVDNGISCDFQCTTSFGIFVAYGESHVIKSNYIRLLPSSIGIYTYGVHNADSFIVDNWVGGPRAIDLRMSESIVLEYNHVYGVTGWDPMPTQVGIGIRSRYGSIRLDRPIVRYNEVWGFGGTANDVGIYVYPDRSDIGQVVVGATPLLDSNTVRFNTYGIVSKESAPTIRGNTLEDNTWSAYVEGRFSDPYFNKVYEATVVSNDIHWRYAAGQGAGIWVTKGPSSPVIGMAGGPNTVRYHRIGIGVTAGATPTIDSNTIYDSQRYGIYSESSSPIVKKNTIYQDGDAGVYVLSQSQSSPRIEDNSIHNNLYGVWVYQSSPVVAGTTRGAQVIQDNSLSNIYLCRTGTSTVIANNLIRASWQMFPIRRNNEVGIQITCGSTGRIVQNDINQALYYGILVDGIGTQPEILEDNRINLPVGIVAGSYIGIAVVNYATPKIGDSGLGNAIAGPVAGVYIEGPAMQQIPMQVKGNTIGGSGGYLGPQRGIWTHLAQGSFLIEENTITGNGRGIYEESSATAIIGNTISWNWGGIEERYSASTITGNIITNNVVPIFPSHAGDGVLLYWSTSIVGGAAKNTISQNGGWGIHMIGARAGNDPLGMQGQTLWNQNNLGSNGMGMILLEWQVPQVHVTSGGNPQSNARVRVFDRDYMGLMPWEQYPTRTFLTDTYGRTTSFLVREYYWDNIPNVWDRQWHRFCAELNGYAGYADIQDLTDNVQSPVEVATVPGGSCPLG